MRIVRPTLPSVVPRNKNFASSVRNSVLLLFFWAATLGTRVALPLGMEKLSRFLGKCAGGLVVGIALFGCQQEESLEKGSFTVNLDIRFPESLSKGTVRYRQLMAKVTSLKVSISTLEGFARSLSVPPEQWSDIKVVGIPFPKTEGDKLEIVAEVWESSTEKSSPQPLLKGSKTIIAGETKGRSEVQAQIKLRYGTPFSQWR